MLINASGAETFYKNVLRNCGCTSFFGVTDDADNVICQESINFGTIIQHATLW